MTTEDSILISLVRKVMPNIIASQIVGVSPMTAPVDDIFKLRTIFEQDARVRMTKAHYKTFLRVNDRPKTQTLLAFRAAVYPAVDLPNVSDTMEAIRWCREQFGEHGYQRIHLKFIFKDDADATVFRLRWS